MTKLAVRRVGSLFVIIAINFQQNLQNLAGIHLKSCKMLINNDFIFGLKILFSHMLMGQSAEYGSWQDLMRADQQCSGGLTCRVSDSFVFPVVNKDLIQSWHAHKSFTKNLVCAVAILHRLADGSNLTGKFDMVDGPPGITLKCILQFFRPLRLVNIAPVLTW